MTAIPLLSGIAGTETGEFVRTYPLNLEPVIVDSQISAGQLKCVQGTVQTGTAYGPDHGGIFWNGALYRVNGQHLIRIDADGTWTLIGSEVGNYGTITTRCAFDYSFDRLAITANGNLFYYAPGLISGNALTRVTDPDIGSVLDMIWIDGYFMTTDGTSIVVTELNDPFSVKPLKYGSAEEDPDPITGLLKYRGEAYVFGRNTIQLFRNIGGNGFPFETILGGLIPFGCVAPAAKCLFGDSFAFVGSGRGEGLNVYIGGQGTAEPIGCRELCNALDALSDPTVVELEARSDRDERRLMIHLPTETWVFLLNASSEAKQPIWYRIATDSNGYHCRNAVKAYGKTWVGDTQSAAYGYLTDSDRTHFGIDPTWQFDAGLLYNQGLGAIVHSLELVGLPGRGGDGTVFMSVTRDGETWGPERAVQLIASNRNRRIAWRPHARIGNYLGLRFRGAGTALVGIAALEAKLAGLSS